MKYTKGIVNHLHIKATAAKLFRDETDVIQRRIYFSCPFQRPAGRTNGNFLRRNKRALPVDRKGRLEYIRSDITCSLGRKKKKMIGDENGLICQIGKTKSDDAERTDLRKRR